MLMLDARVRHSLAGLVPWTHYQPMAGKSQAHLSSSSSSRWRSSASRSCRRRVRSISLSADVSRGLRGDLDLHTSQTRNTQAEQTER